MTLILASSSRSRADMLRNAGVEFEIAPAHADEDAIKKSMAGSGAAAIAGALAELKALTISTIHPKALVLGADQILDFEGEIVSKSESMTEAAALLRRLRGKSHRLVTAAVLALNGAPVWRHVEISTLQMRQFSDEFLRSYLAAEGEDLLSGVGCYRLEGRGAQLFEHVNGDYFAILGLPLLPLLAALRERGILAP
jgi:septum formation protein